jgi:hypothetical protein
VNDRAEQHHDRPPHTLREMLGRATVITALCALAVWLVAAGFAGFTIAGLIIEGDAAATNFALVEMGAALVVLAALGGFATLAAFIVTHLGRALRRPRYEAAGPHDADPDRSESDHAGADQVEAP